MESRLVALKEDWGEMKMQLADCNTKLKVVLQQMKELNIQIRSLATDPTLQSSSSSVLSGSNNKAVLERAPKVAKDVSEQETHGQKLELPASKEGHELSLLVAANEAVVKTEDDVGIDSLVAKAEEGEKVEEYDKKSGLTAAHLEKRMNDKTRAKLEDNRIFTRVCTWASAEECIDGMVGHKGVIFDPGISMLLKKKWTAWVLPSCIWALIREMTPVSQSIFMAYEFYLAVCFNTTLNTFYTLEIDEDGFATTAEHESPWMLFVKAFKDRCSGIPNSDKLNPTQMLQVSENFMAILVAAITFSGVFVEISFLLSDSEKGFSQKSEQCAYNGNEFKLAPKNSNGQCEDNWEELCMYMAGSGFGRTRLAGQEGSHFGEKVQQIFHEETLHIYGLLVWAQESGQTHTGTKVYVVDKLIGDDMNAGWFKETHWDEWNEANLYAAIVRTNFRGCSKSSYCVSTLFNTTLTASGHESEKDVRWFEENYWVSWDEARLNALILEENSCSGYKCDDLLRSRQRSVLLGDTRFVWHPP